VLSALCPLDVLLIRVRELTPALEGIPKVIKGADGVPAAALIANIRDAGFNRPARISPESWGKHLGHY
jgi:hypothetical protein